MKRQTHPILLWPALYWKDKYKSCSKSGTLEARFYFLAQHPLSNMTLGNSISAVFCFLRNVMKVVSSHSTRKCTEEKHQGDWPIVDKFPVKSQDVTCKLSLPIAHQARTVPGISALEIFCYLGTWFFGHTGGCFRPMTSRFPGYFPTSKLNLWGLERKCFPMTLHTTQVLAWSLAWFRPMLISTLPHSAQVHCEGFHCPEAALNNMCETSQFWKFGLIDMNFTRTLKHWRTGTVPFYLLVET